LKKLPRQASSELESIREIGNLWEVGLKSAGSQNLFTDPNFPMLKGDTRTHPASAEDKEKGVQIFDSVNYCVK
jgi:hypothetical protein